MGNDLAPKGWRDPYDWNTGLEKELKKDVAAMQTYKNMLKRKPNIFVIGPTGAGKSSFINSVISVCTGRIAKESKVRECKESCTLKFTKAAVSDPAVGFVMYDSYGVAEHISRGFIVDDIVAVVEGRVKPGYVFDDRQPITEANKDYYIKQPKKEDRIHCVVFVLDAEKLYWGKLGADYKRKLHQLQAKIEQIGIPFVVVVSKCDQICGDMKSIFRSRKVEYAVEEGKKIFQVQLNDVHPLKYYDREVQLDPMLNIPILLALRLILYQAYDYQDRVEANQI